MYYTTKKKTKIGFQKLSILVDLSMFKFYNRYILYMCLDSHSTGFLVRSLWFGILDLHHVSETVLFVVLVRGELVVVQGFPVASCLPRV